MRHFVFVESNTTGTGHIAVQRLLAGGDRVTFLTRTPAKYPFLGSDEPGLSVRELDTNCLPVVLDAVGKIQAREGIDAVLTFSEFYVTIVAELAAALGLPGLDPNAARTCRHKPTTRQTLAAARLLTPEFHVLTCPEEAMELANRISYPCVVKPPSDSSSHGVRLVRDPLELLAHYETLRAWTENVRGQPLDSTVLVESLLEGPEYSVETFTLADGTTQVIGVTDKHLSVAPHFVEVGHDFPSCADAAVQTMLTRTVLKALAAVKFNFGPAHTEIRLTPRGPAVVEINPRLAGGMIPELVNYATGIDLLKAWMALLVSEPFNLTPSRKNSASIRFLMADEAGQIDEIRGVNRARTIPCVREVVVTRDRGAMVRAAEDAYDRIGFVIASGPDPVQVRENLADAMETIRIHVEPIAKEVLI